MSNMEELLILRDKVYSQIEILRREKKIGSSLDCHVHGPFHEWNVLDILDVLIVSQVSLSNDLRVEPANGIKCPRCWKTLENECGRCRPFMN